MGKYKYLIFDYDGTVCDTSPGIFETFRLVFEANGKDCSSVDFSQFIGPPLKYSYTVLFGEEKCEQNIALHRQLYAQNDAIAKSRLYPGIKQALQTLQQSGYVLAIASSKFQPHADQSVARFGLQNIFHSVYGQNDKRTYKAEILAQLLADNGWQPAECLMIGDTCYDLEGARANGVDTMAVTYGFGKMQDLIAAKPDLIARSPEDICRQLCK